MGKTYSNPNVNPNVIGTGEVIDGSLTAADLAANSVTSSELADNAVDTAAIADDAVTSAKIATDAVGSTEIAANAVTSSELADNAVDTAAIADDAVTSAKIATDAVGSTEIAANAVTASELADSAVDTAAIADSAVTTAKLAASAGCGAGTDAAKPAAASVPAGFLYLSTDVAGGTLYRSTGAAWVQAGSSVSAAGVADGGITTAKLADDAVTRAKMGDSDIVTSLPGSPVDGQIVNYQSAAMATDGIVWRFRYNASSASAYKWEFIGGSAMRHENNTTGIESITSTSYTSTGATLSITTPLAGDYDIEWGSREMVNANSSHATYYGFAVGATAADDTRCVFFQCQSAGAKGGDSSIFRQTAIAASTAIAERVKVSGGTGAVRNRFLQIIPVRVA